jgi:AraC family transcriptional regulator
MSVNLYDQSAPPVQRAFPALIGWPGHPGTLHSTFDGTVRECRQIAWTGGSATAHDVQSKVGEAALIASRIELHFSWNSGYLEAEIHSGGTINHYRNRSGYAYILPPGKQVGFRVRKATGCRVLSLELEREFLLHAAALEGSVNFEVIEAWNYRDPLSWQLARIIYDECTSGAPQGTLYAETAVTFLAMRFVRNLSVSAHLMKEISRGGLPPSRLRRTCDYMMGRLGDDISLQEVAASVGLSVGHFSTAFKQSLGVAPHAWLRRQRIERAKILLNDPDLDLSHLAITLGYANQSSLGVAFKRETGVTPTQWRKGDGFR